MNIFDKYMGILHNNIYIENIVINQLKNLTGQTLSQKQLDNQKKEEFKQQIINDKNLLLFNEILDGLNDIQKGAENDKSIIKWILLNIFNNQISLDRLKEDIDSISNSLKFFFKNKSVTFKNKKLINISYKELKDLSLDKTKAKVDKYKFTNNEADKLYEDSTFEVWIPKTFNASCELGSGTSWCTAADSKQSENYFNEYSSKSPLYIIINKNTKEKWQFHKNSDQYMDKTDNSVKISSVATTENFPQEMIKILQKEFPKIQNINLISDPKKRVDAIASILGIKYSINADDSITIDGDLQL